MSAQRVGISMRFLSFPSFRFCDIINQLNKVVLIGDSDAGKSKLLLRFADDPFTESYVSTIGVDFRFRTLKTDGSTVKLQIWDTSGQERFRTITSSYYRGSDSIILLYDATKQASFDHMNDWLREVNRYASPDTVKLLVGNTTNVVGNNKVVSYDDAAAWADSNNMPFTELNLKTEDRCEGALRNMAARLVAIRELRPDDGPAPPQMGKSSKSQNKSMFGGLFNMFGGKSKADSGETQAKAATTTKETKENTTTTKENKTPAQQTQSTTATEPQLHEVHCKNFPPAEESLGINMDPNNLTILSIDKNGWAEKNTDLSKYIAHRIVKLNDKKVTKLIQLEAARNVSGGQDVVLHVQRAEFKIGDLVPVKKLPCKIVETPDSEFVVEWTGPKEHFKSIGLDVDDCDIYAKVRETPGHIKVTLRTTTEEIFKESTGLLQKWDLNSDGIISDGVSSCAPTADLSVMSSEGSSSAFSSTFLSDDAIDSHMIGPYIKQAYLGGGAFGLVYLCYLKEKGPSEKYAIKRVQNVNQREKESAEKEAHLMQKLNHENVTKCVEALSSKDAFYLVVLKHE